MTTIVTAYECGAVVNPDTVISQVEGGTVMALGGALFESVVFDHGRIARPSLAGYRVPGLTDLPELDVVLLDRPDLPSAGAGETPLIAVAPAIANATFAATGRRLRSLPLLPDGDGLTGHWPRTAAFHPDLPERAEPARRPAPRWRDGRHGRIPGGARRGGRPVPATASAGACPSALRAKRMGRAQPAASANVKSLPAAHSQEFEELRRPGGPGAVGLDEVSAGRMRGADDRMRRDGQPAGAVGADCGGEPAGSGQPAQPADEFRALVGDQPGRERAVRLGAGPAVDGDPRLAVLHEQPGRGITRRVHRPDRPGA